MSDYNSVRTQQNADPCLRWEAKGGPLKGGLVGGLVFWGACDMILAGLFPVGYFRIFEIFDLSITLFPYVAIP